jgi:hypothetical protein
VDDGPARHAVSALRGSSSGSSSAIRTFFSNRDINRLTAHATVHKLAWTGANVFSGAYMLHAGLSLPAVFLAFAAIYGVRFVLRPLVLIIAPALGLRQTLMLGTLLLAMQYPVLAFVEGIDTALLLYCLVNALSTVLYMTSFHACFAALGDAERRGSQVGVRQALGTLAGIAGPALGGVLLATYGPLAAFGAAALIELFSIVPLLQTAPVPSPVGRATQVFAGSRTGVLLFATDGWIVGTSILGWNIFIFQAFDGRFDGLGGVLAAGAIAGAISGLLLGHLIDIGHARRATALNAAALGCVVLLKAVSAPDPAVVLAITVAAMFLGGLYVPLLMTAFYNVAKASPSPLNFQFAAEGGWDVGACLASVAAAVCLWEGAPLQLAIAFATPAVVLQACVLYRTYRELPEASSG